MENDQSCELIPVLMYELMITDSCGLYPQLLRALAHLLLNQDLGKVLCQRQLHIAPELHADRPLITQRMKNIQRLRVSLFASPDQIDPFVEMLTDMVTF